MPIERNEDWDEAAAIEADEAFAAIATASIPVNPAKTAEQIFRQNASLAAEQIVALSLGGANERVRLDASKYIIERVLGRVGDMKPLGDDDAPWAGVYGAIIREPSASERDNGKPVTRAGAQSSTDARTNTQDYDG